MSIAPGILMRPGGKARLVKYLLPLIAPHKCYCEVFGGGAALLRSKPRSLLEIFNDTDEVVVNAFRCVRYHPDALEKELAHHVNSRATFIEYKKQQGLTDIQRAARWLFLNALSFGGDSDSFGVQKSSACAGAANSLTNLRGRIQACHKRFERVIVEKLDWQRCVALYDSDEVFFYLDPPYVGGNVKPYRAWTQSEMQQFAEVVKRIKGNWLVTVNDSAANRKLFAFGKQKRITRWRNLAQRNPKDIIRYGELIVWKGGKR